MPRGIKREISRAELISALVESMEGSGTGFPELKRAAEILSLPDKTFRDHLSKYDIHNLKEAIQAVGPPQPKITVPEFPDDDLPVDEIRALMSKRFEKREEYRRAKNWFRIGVNVDGPIGVTFWGDPHVDDDGCNWPLLERHCQIHRETEALYSINIGDSVNGWAGRLARLYADQETSAKTARKLCKWFLQDSGVSWIAWLMGNHDLWTLFPEWLRAHNVARVPMEDWQARFRLAFKNEREVRIWASHDFPGKSIHNSLHGQQRAAHTKAEAHIYAAGHTHNWAIHQEESASRDFTYWLIRSRGYKYIDEYAELHGHFPQKQGASITCIIDPDAESEVSLIQAFADMEEAAEYLKWKRSRVAKRKPAA